MHAYHEWENTHDCWLERQTAEIRSNYHFCPVPEDIKIDDKIQKGTLVDKYAIAHKEAILKAVEADKAAADKHFQLIKEHKANRAKQRQALQKAKPYAKKSSNALLQSSRYSHRKQQKLNNQKTTILSPQQEVVYNAVFQQTDTQNQPEATDQKIQIGTSNEESQMTEDEPQIESQDHSAEWLSFEPSRKPRKTDYEQSKEQKDKKEKFRHFCNELFGNSLDSKFESVI